MRMKALWISILSIMFVKSVAGYTNDTLITVSRYYTADTVTQGDTILISIQIENNQTESLYGLVVSDQVPSGFTILHHEVEIGSTVLDDHVYETGYSGEIYDGNTPRRWVFVTPPSFAEANSIPPGEVARIEYSAECPEAGVCLFKNLSWVGAVLRGNDSLYVFGYGDDSLLIVVNEVGINEDGPHSKGLHLALSNYPNPVKNFTTVMYELPSPAYVTLELYDDSGRIVHTLSRGQRVSGHHRINWNREDLPSGVYFVHLHADLETTTRKIVLMK